MRILFIATVLTLSTFSAYAQAQTEQNAITPQKSGTENAVYRLFPTKNY